MRNLKKKKDSVQSQDSTFGSKKAKTDYEKEYYKNKLESDLKYQKNFSDDFISIGNKFLKSISDYNDKQLEISNSKDNIVIDIKKDRNQTIDNKIIKISFSKDTSHLLKNIIKEIKAI